MNISMTAFVRILHCRRQSVAASVIVPLAVADCIFARKRCSTLSGAQRRLSSCAEKDAQNHLASSASATLDINSSVSELLARRRANRFSSGSLMVEKGHAPRLALASRMVREGVFARHHEAMEAMGLTSNLAYKSALAAYLTRSGAASSYAEAAESIGLSDRGIGAYQMRAIEASRMLRDGTVPSYVDALQALGTQSAAPASSVVRHLLLNGLATNTAQAYALHYASSGRTTKANKSYDFAADRQFTPVALCYGTVDGPIVAVFGATVDALRVAYQAENPGVTMADATIACQKTTMAGARCYKRYHDHLFRVRKSYEGCVFRKLDKVAGVGIFRAWESRLLAGQVTIETIRDSVQAIRIRSSGKRASRPELELE